MSERVFFYVIQVNGADTGHLYHDDPPTHTQLRSVLGKLVFRRELAGDWKYLTIDQLMGEYARWRQAGKLPPDNMRGQ